MNWIASMKYFICSFLTLIVSIFGFIIVPMFIIGVDLRNIHYADITPQAIEARKNLNRMEKEGTIESAEDVEKWFRDINSQPRKKYTDKELYHIAQKNFLWFSWIPVFVIFCFISNNKIKYLIYFLGLSFLAYIFEFLVLSTFLSYISAALLGLFLSETRARLNSKRVTE